MEEYRMGLCDQGKIIWVNECCFCAEMRITDRCSCSLGMPVTSPCKRFERCESVSQRVGMLLRRLPDGYGKPTQAGMEREALERV